MGTVIDAFSFSFFFLLLLVHLLADAYMQTTLVHTAKIIAKQNPSALVVVASRTDPDDSVTTINKANNQSNVQYLPLDLGSRATVRAFASAWKAANHAPISALVLNAGIQFPGEIVYTPDGIEKQFGVNHIGHALLFHLLTDSLTRDARIVVVSSGTHDPAQKSGLEAYYTSAEDVARPSKESIKKSYGRGRYATSKVANVLWTYALARRLPRGQTVTVMDPGLMSNTSFNRNASPLLNWIALHAHPSLVPIVRFLLGTENVHLPAESGAALARLAVGDDEGVKGKTGVYFEGLKEIPSSVQTQEVDLQEELWEWTVKFVGESSEEVERFRKGE
ncbi:NAD(P)-binding protein [Pleomassaria siparia CBS 279.74]|uniref:NAD(P)-binding protein n=1 Tax=Pleomassaria siparia CBS 279.74 TaxID=1314801 RepID=A0A6G1K3I6_9PLEO|nr:NAD(P)-binding protein [Pleomassaria siparia CBS 279.74]